MILVPDVGITRKNDLGYLTMSDIWELDDRDWGHLAHLLPETPKARTRAANRQAETRLIAQACLLLHYETLAPSGHGRGWQQLKGRFGVPHATANRRYLDWCESGDWERFWDGLLDLRHGTGRAAAWRTPPAAVPTSPLDGPVVEAQLVLERAFRYLFARFFGHPLPLPVRITIEGGHRRHLGHFAPDHWRPPGTAGPVHHVMMSAVALARGKVAALEVLLHELVHYRNHHVGLHDCSAHQYHNEHFRESARLAGLSCPEKPDPNYGYARTTPGTRAREAIEAFELADESIFAPDGEWARPGLLLPPSPHRDTIR